MAALPVPDPSTMPAMASMRTRLLRLRIVRDALASELQPLVSARRPSARLMAGVLCIVLSYLMAWPAMTALAVAAAWSGKPIVAVIGAPILYGGSWIVWLTGVWVTGSESVGYFRAAVRWVVRRLFARFLPDNGREDCGPGDS